MPPPDLSALLAGLFPSARRLSFELLVLVAALIAGLWSSVYTVPSDSVAVVQRSM